MSPRAGSWWTDRTCAPSRQHSLRANIGIVQQDVFLFAGTIYDNIRYGRPDATEAEIVEAAKRAEIYDDILDMPDGFQT